MTVTVAGFDRGRGMLRCYRVSRL